MEIISIILELLLLFVAIIGLTSAWYFWKRSYREIKFMRDLKQIDYMQEHSFALLGRFVKEALDKEIEIDNPYSKGTPQWALFNMVTNLYQQENSK